MGKAKKANVYWVDHYKPGYGKETAYGRCTYRVYYKCGRVCWYKELCLPKSVEAFMREAKMVTLPPENGSLLDKIWEEEA